MHHSYSHADTILTQFVIWLDTGLTGLFPIVYFFSFSNLISIFSGIFMCRVWCACLCFCRIFFFGFFFLVFVFFLVKDSWRFRNGFREEALCKTQDLLIDLNGMSSRLGLFYAQSLWNRVTFTFIFTDSYCCFFCTQSNWIWIILKQIYWSMGVALTIFTNPSARAGEDTRSVFNMSLTGLNSEFSFS